MIKLNRWIRCGLAAGAIVMTACVDDLTDVNQNPNAPTDVGPEFLLPQSMQVAIEQTFGSGLGMLSHTMIWPQHGVEIQYPDEEQGNVRPSSMQDYWDTYYSQSLQDIRTVIKKGRAANKPNVEAVGMIWETWLFHQLTDLFGDIPYSQALKGDEGTSAPAYDTQQQVYTGMIQTLKDAVAKLDVSGAGFGNGDILYGNDFTKWRRFANSLRMRLAMRLSQVDANLARTEFIAANTAGGFLSNADNAMFKWPGAPYRNPIFEDWQGRDDHGVSATLIDTLRSFADPRLELYAERATADGQYRGLRNGVRNPPLSIANYSRIGNFWRRDGAATPSAIITWSEVLFLQAEAANRGWITGTPGTLYAQAIRANMNQYDEWAPANAPTDAEIDAYLVNPRVIYNAATGLRQIHFQQWLALFMNGNETWSNWRRTGVPELVKGPDMPLARIPVRFKYPDLEQSLNKVNLDAALARQNGGLDLITPLWWDR